MNKLLRSEWIKFSSIRSNFVLLAIGLALNLLAVITATATFGRETFGSVPDTTVENRISLLSSGSLFWGLLVAIVGILAFGTEYRHKTIVPSTTAAPIRTELTGAKAIFSGLVGLAAGVVISIINVAIVTVWLGTKNYHVGLADAEFARTWFALVLFGGVIAIFGVGVGAIFRNSSLAITVMLVWALVVETALTGFLPDRVSRVLPFQAAEAMTSPHSFDLSPYEGGAVFALWSVVVLAVGLVVFQRRDLND